MPLLDYDTHLSIIRSQVGDDVFEHPVTIPYKPLHIKIGDYTKVSGKGAGADFNFKPWPFKVNPKSAASLEQKYFKLGCLFVSNLRKLYTHGGAIGKNAVITYHYRCELCAGMVRWYTPPPPYDESEPCHDVMKLLKRHPELQDVFAFRRRSDQVIVMAKDWSWETLKGEEEVEALYRKGDLGEEANEMRRTWESLLDWDTTRKRIEYI